MLLTSTTCLLAEFSPGEDPHDKPGFLEAVIDSSGNVVCVTAVQVIRLSEVTTEHDIAEGEGYATVAQWRTGDEEFWHSPACVADLGELSIDDDTLVVCCQFEIYRRYPVTTSPPH